MIYDSTYTEKEFPVQVGWGHSTWEEGMRLCRAANAKSLAIYHHDPDHDELPKIRRRNRRPSRCRGVFA